MTTISASSADTQSPAHLERASTAQAKIDALAERRFDFGRDHLGPIFEWFLYRLDNHLTVAAEREALTFFVARAGVRIHDLYLEYLAKRARTPDQNHKVLWASRLLFCKMFGLRAPAQANQQLSYNFRGRSTGQMLEGLLRHESETSEKFDWDDPGLKKPADTFSILEPNRTLGQSNANRIRHYFEDYAILGDTYLRSLGLHNSRPVVLVDSGWQGSMHSLAVSGISTSDVTSLYFGAFAIDDDRQIPAGVIGLVVGGPRFHSQLPEASLLHYRHLVEAVLEANVDSAESLRFDGSAVIPDQKALDRPDPDRGLDSVYLGIRDYLAQGDPRSPGELSRRFNQAADRLANVIRFPSSSDTAILSPGSRSGDFGRDVEVTIPLPTVDRHNRDSPDLRVQDSLWPQAQALVEFDHGRACQVLEELANNLTAEEYFAPSTMASDWQPRGTASGKVLICTRTKNRPLLLQRAATSVANQSYQNFEWVVVNDGGELAAVQAVLDNCEVDPSRITLVSNLESTGMEAASNRGIASCDSEFVVIHDDDDSWEPDFLTTAVRTLADNTTGNYGGVVLGSTRVDEIIKADGVDIVGSSPYNPWLTNITIGEMLAGNLFPPIAFVYYRSVYDQLGGYDESLPVLGDWDFNIRFLMQADIIARQEPLANYHHRVPGTSVSYSNSVIGGQSKHVEYRALLLNRYLRGDHGAHLALLTSQSWALGSLRNEVRSGQSPRPGSPDSDVSSSDDLWVIVNWLANGGGGGSQRESSPPATLEKWRKASLGPDRGQFKAPSDFNETTYLNTNPDVADAVATGQLASGFEHYIRFGRSEGRPRPSL